MLLSCIILIVYSNTFSASWHLDDYSKIVENPRIKISNLRPKTLYHTFFSSMDSGLALKNRLYRPVACLTLALNWYIGQKNVFGYHVVNTTIHIITAFLLFLTICSLFKTPNLKGRYEGSEYFIALMAATLWAIHPMQIQAITYIVQRMASLAAMFYLLGLLGYLKGRLSEFLLIVLCSITDLSLS